MKNIAIGIDIGGTNIELAWVKPDGSMIKTLSYKTADFPQVENFIEKVGNTILSVNKELSDFEISGIGIGAPNGNYFTGSIEFAPNLKWEGKIELAKLIEQKTNLKSQLTNDANAAAFAEKLFGGAKQMNNFLVVTLGTGLGSGIFVNGEILYGSTGFAGELGHTTAIENGRKCGCGKKGCLESYASATGIVKTAKEFLALSKIDTELSKKENFDAKDIFVAAQNNDKLALETIKYTGEILGKSLTDYVALFSPEAIFLTGGLAKAHSLLIPATENAMNKNMLKIFKETAKILPSSLLEQNAGLLGAAAMAISNE
jgi:glucokinase